MKITIIQHVNIKWMIKDTDYGVTLDGRVFNIKRRKEMRKTVIGATKGVYINGKFKSLTTIRKLLVQIEEFECPF